MTAASAGILATFVVGVATVCIGLWNAVHSYRATRISNFINTVTRQRIEWMEKVRDDVATYSGLIYTWCFSRLEGKPEEFTVLRDVDRLRHLIRLRLNPEGDRERAILALLDRIPMLTHESQHEELKRALGDLTDETQRLLKDEWERVKSESQTQVL